MKRISEQNAIEFATRNGYAVSKDIIKGATRSFTVGRARVTHDGRGGNGCWRVEVGTFLLESSWFRGDAIREAVLFQNYLAQAERDAREVKRDLHENSESRWRGLSPFDIADRHSYINGFARSEEARRVFLAALSSP